MRVPQKATVRRVSLGTERRVIAISDIHGKLSWLKRLLERVAFGPRDYLVIVGDVVERGEESLATLRYVMELCRRENVYFVTGNCDTLSLDLWAGNHGAAGWLAGHPESHMLQLAREGGFAYGGVDDLLALKMFLFAQYPREMAFLTQSPTILEAEHLVFVHGGVPSMVDMDQLDAYPCMKNDDFLGQGHAFPKYCVVGHWPTTLYRESVPCCNPIMEHGRKIISIDGGCGVKVGGQLNALILPSGEAQDFSWVSYDDYPVAVALDGQEQSLHPVTIRWVDNTIEVLERGEEFSLCRQVSTDRTLWVLTKYLRHWGGADHCEDATDYRLGVTAGDRLSVVERTSRGCLVKKNGTIGWYMGRLKTIEK